MRIMLCGGRQNGRTDTAQLIKQIEEEFGPDWESIEPPPGVVIIGADFGGQEISFAATLQKTIEDDPDTVFFIKAADHDYTDDVLDSLQAILNPYAPDPDEWGAPPVPDEVDPPIIGPDVKPVDAPFTEVDPPPPFPNRETRDKPEDEEGHYKALAQHRKGVIDKLMRDNEVLRLKMMNMDGVHSIKVDSAQLTKDVMRLKEENAVLCERLEKAKGNFAKAIARNKEHYFNMLDARKEIKTLTKKLEAAKLAASNVECFQRSLTEKLLYIAELEKAIQGAAGKIREF